jgi:two-component system NtrC family response regulator
MTNSKSSGKKRSRRILVIEDDTTLNRMLLDQLNRIGFKTRGAATREQALKVLEDFEPDLAILDMRLPDIQGMEFLPELHSTCPVVILTAYGSIDQAVKAVKAGAAEYLIKPVSPASLELAVRRAMENEDLKRNARFWEAKAKPENGPHMIGSGREFKKVQDMISLVAPVETTVLIEGESGVGKELVAGSIHEQSERADQHFVAIDCCTLQENLFESELFGHEKGAFTGADRKKIGLIEVAEHGTVFLDEIGEISPVIQAKLLRVLETGKYRRLGGVKDLSADVRFVAATNRSLQEMIEESTFRADLYYRLSAFTIEVPALRKRKSDIKQLAVHFLEARKFQRNVKKVFAPATIKALAAYHWPGNVRELKNVVERSILISANSARILPEHVSLPEGGGGKKAAVDLSFDHEPTFDEVRREYLVLLLDEYEGNRRKVANILGISERNTYRLIKKLELEDQVTSPL